MRIAINSRLLIPGKLDGIGWFTAETVSRIVASHPEHEFFLFYDRKSSAQSVAGKNVHPVVLFPPARHPFLWILYFEASTQRALRKYKIELYISTDGWMPVRPKVRSLDVIHDLNFEHSANYLRPVYQWYMKKFFPRFAHNASRLATVSEFSKKDIAQTYGISPSKIDVVYDGAHADYRVISPEEQQAVREKYSDGNPFFIFIGNISPRKNLSRTLQAFDRVCDRYAKPLRMLVVGAHVDDDGLHDTIGSLRHATNIVFLGHLPTADLSRLLASSVALLYTSLFEGFGIPILEAFNAGTAVVTSNTTSMPEVAGDAALLVNPQSVDAIAEAMYQILTDTSLRNSLIAKGMNQRKLFSWERTADLLWQSAMLTAQPDR